MLRHTWQHTSVGMGGSLPAHIHFVSKAFAHLRPKKWAFVSLSGKEKKRGLRLPSESPCGLLESREYNWEEQQRLPTAEALCRVLRGMKDFSGLGTPSRIRGQWEHIKGVGKWVAQVPYL